MLFNSLAFLAFFVATYGLYWAMRGRYQYQNALLLAASYFFYACWDWRFLSLILISTVVDYTVALRIDATNDERQRRRLLLVSLGANLGMLGFFKYAGFFADSFADLASSLGIELGHVDLNIVLPVGISFYTFQTLSYTIDVYRRRQAVARPLDFALFVAFFPQLVAGPIERASRLLQQIARPRTPTAGQAHTGAFLIVWGLFKKSVIADNLALVADPVFASYGDHTGATLLIAAIAFSVQIYCDFSGYSDIARGVSKLMGFELMLNFRLPYFARSPSEFWARWHISLSQWLRDYLYIPLGGNRGSALQTYRNLFLTMLLGGLWHGASWNFVLWGAFHGAILIAYRVAQTDEPRIRGVVANLAATGLMLSLTLFGWILFRCTSYDQLVHVISNVSLAPSPAAMTLLVQVAMFSSPLIAVQLAQHLTGDLDVWRRLPLPVQGIALGSLVCGLFLFGVREPTEFIYFQF